MKFVTAAACAALLLAACGEKKEEPTLDGAPSAAAPAPASAAGMEMPPNEVCYAKQMTMAEAQEMQKQGGMTCTEENFATDGKTGHSVCAMQGMTVTTDFAVSGDFNTAYTMQMTSSMDPAPPGMPQPSVTTIKMERLGDCDAPKTP